MSTQNGEKDRLFSKHLLLVIILVAALLITEGLIFGLVKTTDAKFSDILALTFGTFGAWIGAGAAYFFGRENLKSATESMIKISRSSRDILSNVIIKEMNPRKVKTIHITSTIADVIKWLKEDVWNFFFALVEEDEKLRCTVNEEAVYKYILDQLSLADNSGKTAAALEQEIHKKPITALIEYFQKSTDAKARGLVDAAVELSEDMTVSDASDAMEKSKKLWGIILNADKKPTGFITTNDIRRFLMTQ